MRRGGDGKDIQWLKGPQTMCTHTMGCWSDGEMVYVDMDGGDGNQFPFFPSPNPNDRFDPVKATGGAPLLDGLQQEDGAALRHEGDVRRSIPAASRGRMIATTPCPIAMAS